ncbi:MAG TPA: diguanylate cyclase [Thermoanaerobaculia bacterium]|nr:diguanylate cyclase [Thermoanaerobaculia bacterium]
MRPVHATRLAGVLACALLPGNALAQGLPPDPRESERGFPLIQTYAPDLDDADTQNFGITRDPRGVLYVGNLRGALVYDGAWWRLIPIGKPRSAFNVESDQAGRVGVGGVDELGYLGPDAQGSLRYVSLVSLLRPEQRQFGQTLQVHATPAGFAFTTRRWLLFWDGATITTVATFPGDRPYAAAFAVGDALYVWTRAGIMRLSGARLEPVPGGEAFRGRRVDMILPADPPAEASLASPAGGPSRGGLAGGSLLVSVRGEGLFVLAAGKTEPFAREASRWAAVKKILSGCRLADGRWALGSVLGGLLLLRPDGMVDQVIDTTVGLPDDFVSGVVADREGALWLSFNNGLARVDVASPVSVVDARSGLKGQVSGVARHRGRLLVATSAGVFAAGDRDRPSESNGRRGQTGQAGGQSGGRAAALPGKTTGMSGQVAPEGSPTLRLRPLAGLPDSVWSLLSAGDDLLVGSAFGLYAVHGASCRLIAGTEGQIVYALKASLADPQRVLLGTEDGLAAVRREAEGWRFEGMVEGGPRNVRTIVERRGRIVWCGSTLDGVTVVELPPGWPRTARRPRSRRIGERGEVALFSVAGRIVAAGGGRVLAVDEARSALVADPALAVLEGHPISNLVEDGAGNLWVDTRPLSVAVRQGGGWGGALRALAEVPARIFAVLVAEQDGVVWLGTENGLIRYAGPFRSREAPLPAPLLSRLTVGGDQLLFGGAPGATPAAADLPADVRRLRIEFAPLSARPGLRFQIRLDPLDADWGSPAAEPFAELTRLPPGHYEFQVRTVGPSHERGPATAWSFSVRPPWYLTLWAFALWAGLAAGGVRGYARLRHRALAQRAAHLESRVAEQTVELRQKVSELRRAQAELEAVNMRLEELTLQDDLTGVANRRCLQQALDEEWSRARRHRLPLGLALLDLDHFKLLNDTRGHPEGDQCLRAVAGFLAATVRRSGDLVARYGGEEFALLLPATDLAGVGRVAEELRRGIEALAIPHEAVAGGRLTASFGVAAMIPDPDQELDVLVEAADQALYRAKTEGRNRVCAAAASSGGVSRAAAAGLGPVS